MAQRNVVGVSPNEDWCVWSHVDLVAERKGGSLGMVRRNAGPIFCTSYRYNAQSNEYFTGYVLLII